ncbi:hypothetical protein ROTAS13_04467 [Roseomonas sp. TAS13]|nr:hypothetical protein ROTAS13_04467 [Roseomonas sp. TAS13]
MAGLGLGAVLGGQRGELHRELLVLPVAARGQRGLGAGVVVGDHPGQLARAVDRGAVHGGDHVARLEPGAGGGAVGLDLGHQRALGLGQLQRLRHGGGHRLGAGAKEAALDMAVLLQLRHHRLDDVGGDGEADADRAAAGREDGGVDADHRAVLGEERATGIAAVDRGIDLQEVVIGAGADVAAAGRDHARRDGAAEAEGIAHRHHPVARAGLVGIAQLQERQVAAGIDLQQRQVGALVAAHDPGRQLAPVIQRHLHRGGVLHDMVVGDDMALGIDQEAGAQRLGHAAARPALGGTEIAAEHAVLRRARREGRAGLGLLLRLLDGGDGHHRRADFGDQIGKARKALHGRGHHGGGGLDLAALRSLDGTLGEGGRPAGGDATQGRAGQQHGGEGGVATAVAEGIRHPSGSSQDCGRW